MSIAFNTKRKSMRELPLAAMIDVVFILIFFFMLTTSFQQVESMELMLPSSGAKASHATKSSTIILRGDTSIQFGQRSTSLDELKATLSSILNDEPTHAFIILVDDKVSMQRMVTMMDTVNVVGGKSLYVRPLSPGGKK